MDEGENSNWSETDVRYNLTLAKPVFGVFCSGIRYSCTELELHDLFSKYGTVIYAWIPFLRGGKRSGNGIVMYSRESEAKAAIESLDGQTYEGRVLKLSRYEPRPPRSRSRPRDYDEPLDRHRRREDF